MRAAANAMQAYTLRLAVLSNRMFADRRSELKALGEL
jgi:hypothetical protein